MADDLKAKLVLELIDKVTAPLKEVESSLSQLKSIQKSLTETANAATSATTSATRALKGNTEATEKDTLAKNKQKNAIQDLGKSLIELGAGLGIKHELTEILEIGKEYQSLNFKFAGVLGDKLNSKEVDDYTKKMQKLAETGVGTYEQISETARSLFSAGLTKDEAWSGTQIAMKVAKITGGRGCRSWGNYGDRQ